MRQLKRLGPALLAALALAGLAGAGGASATVLEIDGQGALLETTSITGSLEAGNAFVLKFTNGSVFNSCSTSNVSGHTTSPFTASGSNEIGGTIDTLTFTGCQTEGVEVIKPGQLDIGWISGTTNGTVTSTNAEVKVPSPIGKLTCTTGAAGTDIGELTGVTAANTAAGIKHATLHVKAVLNCGFLAPTATWGGTYVITSPTGLGVLDAPPPATTLEVGGTPKNESVEITASLESGGSTLLQTTTGAFLNTCTSSHAKGATVAPYSEARVSAPLSELSFSKCTTEGIKVDKLGSLNFEWIEGTTNGTVRSAGAEVTVPSPIGALNCKTGEGVDIGTLTGKASGQATLDVSAVLNCGFLVPSGTWNASYVVTSPEGLGVTA